MASYCALGRLKQLIVFDIKENFTESVKAEYHRLYETLNGERVEPISICVFIKPTVAKTHHIDITQSPSIQFIGVYVPALKLPAGSALPSAIHTDIDTFWTQDIFVMKTSDEAIYFPTNTTNQYQHVFDSLSTLVPGIQVSQWLVDIDGGNLLHGRTEDGDYLLVGPDFKGYGKYPARQIEITRLVNEFQISPSRAFRLLDSYFDQFDNLFYHADLFCTITGPTDTCEDLILFAQLEGQFDSLPPLTEINRHLRNRAEYIQRKLSGIKKNVIAIEYIPMLLINYSKGGDADKKFEMVISFNNMIVENYRDESGDHIRVAYIPDYKDAINKYYNMLEEEGRYDLILNSYSLCGDLSEIASFTAGVAMNEMNEIELFIAQAEEAKSQVKSFVNLKTEEVETKLHGLGFQRVVRVPMKQYRTDLERGASSLHCRLKVIERDCLP